MRHTHLLLAGVCFAVLVSTSRGEDPGNIANAARDAARQAQSANNLKQLALAMQMYVAANRHFPAAAVTGSDGKTKHSWRVAILPYVEQRSLYDQYRFDEPWDSENNKKLI